ncbi:MAG: sugar ABC transporter ATP-binding protein [Nakamurella sp.]
MPTDDVDVPLLQMRNVVKTFPGVKALDGVDLDVRAGEVHCLLGQNGAGKSTLIKVLSGAYHPDSGEIRWEGELLHLSGPQSAVAQGIATIYQELDLVGGLSVAENVYLGHEQSTAGFGRRTLTTKLVRAHLLRLGHPEIDPSMEVSRLSAAQQQIVSMARALSYEARVMIMDEPSAILDPEEVAGLFRLINELKQSGVAIIYISHRLEEIQRIGDRITVLKDGVTVGSDLKVSETPTRELIKLMTGRSIEYAFPVRPAIPADASVVLEVDGLSRPHEFFDVSFTVRAGEIVGIAGLVGAGRSEVVETVFGARRAHRGTVRVQGRAVRNGSVVAAVRAGMGLCPEERKAQALLLQEPVYRNVGIASLTRFATAGFTHDRAELRAATRELDAIQLPRGQERRIISGLSGGNQQKSVVARWLLRGCKVLLLDEPTRGVDVGARSDIYRIIRDLAISGVAVVMVSSEIEEVLGLADRAIVMAEGRVVHEGPTEGVTERDVLDLIMRGDAA